MPLVPILRRSVNTDRRPVPCQSNRVAEHPLDQDEKWFSTYDNHRTGENDNTNTAQNRTSVPVSKVSKNIDSRRRICKKPTLYATDRSYATIAHRCLSRAIIYNDSRAAHNG